MMEIEPIMVKDGNINVHLLFTILTISMSHYDYHNQVVFVILVKIQALNSSLKLDLEKQVPRNKKREIQTLTTLTTL